MSKEIKNTIELRKVLGIEGELEEFVYDSLFADFMQDILDTLNYYIDNERLEEDVLPKIITAPQEVIADIYSCIKQDFSIRVESFLILGEY